MATPGASPLVDLTSAYASVCAEIRDVLASPKPTYVVDGVSMDRNAYLDMLMRQEETLRKIPGVAPTTNPSVTYIE